MYYRRWRDFNWYLFFGMLVLIGFGLMLVWSTTVGKANHDHRMFIKHLRFLVLGLAGFSILSIFDYHNFRPLAKPLYCAGLLLLLLVVVAGRVRDGAQTEFGGFQPSEPAKLLLIIALSTWWSVREEKPGANRWLTLGVSLAMAGVPIVLVLLEPDLGTSMVLSFTWLAIAWSAGIRWYQLAALAALALPLAWFGWSHVLKPYQQGRLVAFRMTENQVESIPDPQIKRHVAAVFYQTNQSLVAIGHGGLWGQGLNNGTQSQRDFLPVQYTDFIFAVAGEELGFVGATALLAFECFVLWQAVSIALRARDLQGRLLASGIVGMLLTHVTENIGMNMKLLPMTGIPLPFISYGGSFTITAVCSLGILQSIAIRRRNLVF
ncbi:MAG: FtsW/RodA/SpoVE family cell cycle protein [Herpetosiphon sp.]